MRRYKNEKYNHLANVQHAFQAEAKADSLDITMYGDIGESWWSDSTSAVDIERALQATAANVINIHLNSPGGDVFDGIAIYNQLKNHPAKVIIHVDGLAASAASIIAMAADELIMNTGSMLMIHEASTWTWGTKLDIRKTLNALEGIDKSIADIYMTRYKGERSEMDTMIANETWFTANEAVEMGLAHQVNEQVEDNDVVDPEEFKNHVLQKFRNQKKQSEPIVAGSNENILTKFKRS
ncbi:head maturation protease, ClpP-related [Bacillus thuringiensis]|uniref:head maturation protease, ClpP-related n=1 Tax=Bacillus thuringiensis TaxID=1428 RepID=UPI000BEDC4EF|nr:head maturation protease, ClpP-related [Bacillus thuringiensis]EKS8371201.1 Clp protease ClpP [Bacillus cereus]MBG9492626.1 Clp protease ClpP [Bacillus thuringiensis]MBG9504047.1 Clp protease ClpP [Bacillus thuringiensis]MBG9509884.1 Clp protease ClpP [Bacillus thuringiensis]MBG9516655.1 Clp protease ClpP [Bacillus thuringiensis]